jgi:hypothetical protein
VPPPPGQRPRQNHRPEAPSSSDRCAPQRHHLPGAPWSGVAVRQHGRPPSRAPPPRRVDAMRAPPLLPDGGSPRCRCRSEEPPRLRQLGCLPPTRRPSILGRRDGLRGDLRQRDQDMEPIIIRHLLHQAVDLGLAWRARQTRPWHPS